MDEMIDRAEKSESEREQPPSPRVQRSNEFNLTSPPEHVACTNTSRPADKSIAQHKLATPADSVERANKSTDDADLEAESTTRRALMVENRERARRSKIEEEQQQERLRQNRIRRKLAELGPDSRGHLPHRQRAQQHHLVEEDTDSSSKRGMNEGQRQQTEEEDCDGGAPSSCDKQPEVATSEIEVPEKQALVEENTKPEPAKTYDAQEEGRRFEPVLERITSVIRSSEVQREPAKEQTYHYMTWKEMVAEGDVLQEQRRLAEAKASQAVAQEPKPSIQPKPRATTPNADAGKKTHIKIKRQEMEFTIRELEEAKANSPESWGTLELDGVLYWLKNTCTTGLGGQVLP